MPDANRPAWRVVQDILLDNYGEHQECGPECTHASIEETTAHEVAAAVVVALLAQGWDGPT